MYLCIDKKGVFEGVLIETLDSHQFLTCTIWLSIDHLG